MVENFYVWIFKVVMTFPYIIGGVTLFLLGIQRSGTIYPPMIGGKRDLSFRNIFTAYLYMMVGIASLAGIVFFTSALPDWRTLILWTPIYCIVFLFILPIGVIGTYWTLYRDGIIWNRQFPSFWAKRKGDEQLPQIKIRVADLRLSKSLIFTFGASAFLSFSACLYVLFTSRPNTVWTACDWITSCLMSGVVGLGAFIVLAGAVIVRRVEKLRAREEV